MKRLLSIAIFVALALNAYAQATTQPAEDLDLQYGSELLKKGTPAPEFTLSDINGKKFSLSDFRGSTTLLVFWASWCPDCRAEVPLLKEIYDGSDRARLNFVSISYDKDLETLKAFVKENGLPGVQLFDPAGKKESKPGADYHVKWIPSLYVIDAEGKVLLATVMAEKVAALLGSSLAVGPYPASSGASSARLCTDESCAL
jgi:peroxiredoxin